MTTDLSKYDANQLPNADVLGRQRYAIVVADWNSEITYAMAQGAIDTYIKHGVPEDNIDVLHVPGTVELTFGAARIMKEERVDAVIVIGCVIQGETRHFDFICEGVANGLTALNAEGKIPVIFGVLTTDNLQQALDRSGGRLGNKGVEAAVTALKMLQFVPKIS